MSILTIKWKSGKSIFIRMQYYYTFDVNKWNTYKREILLLIMKRCIDEGEVHPYSSFGPNPPRFTSMILQTRSSASRWVHSGLFCGKKGCLRPSQIFRLQYAWSYIATLHSFAEVRMDAKGHIFFPGEVQLQYYHAHQLTFGRDQSIQNSKSPI